MISIIGRQTWVINGVYVKSKFRGSGIYAKLLKYNFALAKKKGISKMIWFVNVNNLKPVKTMARMGIKLAANFF